MGRQYDMKRYEMQDRQLYVFLEAHVCNPATPPTFLFWTATEIFLTEEHSCYTARIETRTQGLQIYRHTCHYTNVTVENLLE
ncbi:unnamed protein product, partial [Brenthis ino]